MLLRFQSIDQKKQRSTTLRERNLEKQLTSKIGRSEVVKNWKSVFENKSGLTWARNKLIDILTWIKSRTTSKVKKMSNKNSQELNWTSQRTKL